MANRYFIIMVLATTGIVQAASPAATSETELRRNLAWQIALERVGYSPGLIDGRVGAKTRLATREFQRVRKLPQTGELDNATTDALQIAPDDAIGRYVIQSADLDQIGPAPKSWIAKSKLDRLGHESLETVLSEKFHCSVALLRTLNPGRAIDRMQAGDKLAVPMPAEVSVAAKARRLEVDLTGKTIRVIGEKDQLIGLFHCSVAADKAKLPRSNASVVVIAKDPTYVFDPDKWPEVKERIDRKLTIPPGPRNPVGRCWIGLSLPGYGMHGTPTPEMIGKTGSHGCFRLTNWDALRLRRMVRVGTPVEFSGHPDLGLASAGL